MKFRNLNKLFILSIFAVLFMSNAYSIDTSNIIRYYTFDDSDTIGSTSIDLSGNANASITDLTTGVTGILGEAYENPDGGNRYVFEPNYAGTEEFTVSIWAKGIGENDIISADDEGVQRNWAIRPTLLFNFVGSSANVVNYPSPINDNSWHYVIMTYNSTGLYAYINGTLVGSDSSFLPNGNTFLSSLFIFKRKNTATLGFNGILDEVMIMNKSIDGTEAQDLYINYLGGFTPFDTNISNDIIPIYPTNGTEIPYNVGTINLSVSTLVDSSCNYILNNGTNTTFTQTGLQNHLSNVTFSDIFNESVNHDLNYRCESSEETLFENVQFTQLAKPFNLTLDSPVNGTNYTFDVTTFWINATTTYNDSSCSVNDGSQDINLSGDGTSHFYLYDMGSAQNFTKQFNFNLTCSSPSSLNIVSKLFTVYQQGIPLNLTIFVPQNLQTFNFDTEQITYHIETNYLANCEYTTLNETANFTQTGNIVHRTNYTTFFPEIREYPTSFTCNGVLINESVTLNVTYFLDEIPVDSNGVLLDTTGQLPQVGSDLGGFLDRLKSGVVIVLLIPLIFAFFAPIFALIVYLITFSAKGKK